MENQLSTEDQILEAAERLFLDKGFAMTSTTEIAKKAGCNQALIHYYFRTKENLFLRVFESKFVEFTASINPALYESMDIKDRLKAIISAHIDTVARNPKMPFLIVNEFTLNPERFGQVVEEVKTLVAPIVMKLASDLKKEEKEGRIREVDPFNLLFSIVSMDVFMFIAKPLITQIKEMDESEYKEFLQERKEHIFDLIWNGIKK